MADNEAPDRQAEQEQQEQHSEHINEMFAGDSEEEFVYTETSKPINRNAVVLLLIALVGASMIYLMYLRGRFNADQQTSSDAEASQKVSGWIPEADANIRKLKQQLDDTEDRVKRLNANPSGGQVPVENLNGNPFGFGEVAPKPAAGNAAASAVVAADPATMVGRALEKIDVQMILYGSNSSVQINNYLYKVGDTFTVESVPFTIGSITRDSVVLKHAQGQSIVKTAGAKGL